MSMQSHPVRRLVTIAVIVLAASVLLAFNSFKTIHVVSPFDSNGKIQCREGVLVVDVKNPPISDVRIVLKDAQGRELSGTTDSQGKVRIFATPVRLEPEWWVCATKAGFEGQCVRKSSFLVSNVFLFIAPVRPECTQTE
jgi:hypothetical protein